MKYIREKFGSDKVGQMVTFQTMKGRGAFKDVMRAHGGMSNTEMNEVTANIIEEHKITDELQKMKEERGESSILQWCLENTGNKLKKWCSIGENGELEGPLAPRFAQAMRLEGVKTNSSRHPSGVIIAPEPIAHMCPMIYNKEDPDNPIAGFEMNDLEAVGGIKFDLLGLTLLDKTMGIQSDLLTGEVHEIPSLIS
jgi:DNA polymerase-3 subunit alpha